MDELEELRSHVRRIEGVIRVNRILVSGLVVGFVIGALALARSEWNLDTRQERLYAAFEQIRDHELADRGEIADLRARITIIEKAPALQR